ncbi:MAG: type VI secretion system contractile sheath small subunit [Gammaproteobacteria bacterium]|nr:type VI secretion system contractile sheath small subunit [Gammaproteobacteria bacterium]
MSSITEKLEKVRKPRVHIKYEVEVGDSIVQKELPFVVGALGDYAGNAPGESLKPLKERKFINIDQDNFDEVLAKQKPGLSYRVNNELSANDSELKIDLQFSSMADFEPENVIAQIPALKALKDKRDKLRDLLSKADNSSELESVLEAILQDAEKIQSIRTELNTAE